MASGYFIITFLFFLTIPIHTGWIKEYGKKQAEEVFADIPKRVSVEPNQDHAREYKMTVYGQSVKSVDGFHAPGITPLKNSK